MQSMHFRLEFGSYSLSIITLINSQYPWIPLKFRQEFAKFQGPDNRYACKRREVKRDNKNSDVPLDLVAKKIKDHHCDTDKFIALLDARKQILLNVPDANSNFIWEMRRFLPPQVVSGTIENDAFWEYLTDLIRTECDHVIHKLAKS